MMSELISSPKVSRFWLPTSTNSFFWSLPRACGLRWEHRLSGKATASLSNSALSLSQETYDVRTSLSDIRIIWFFYWSIIKTSYYTIQCHHVKDWSFRNMHFCNAPKNDDPLVLNSERPKQICSFQWMKGYELLLELAIQQCQFDYHAAGSGTSTTAIWHSMSELHFYWCALEINPSMYSYK